MIKYLIEKEFKQIFRNPFVPRAMIGMSIMMMLVLPWATDFEIKNINLAVVDKDHSTLSERLTHKLEASRYFKLVQVTNSSAEALKSVESNDADIILEIQQGFEDDLMREGVGNTQISANSVNSSKSGLGSSYLNNILADFNAEIRTEFAQSTSANIPQLKVTTLARYNPHLNYKVFMLPGLMVMMLTMLGGFLPALNIVGEKETGTIEQINVTPVSRFSFILAKLLSYWIILFVLITFCFFLVWIAYGLLPAGSYLTIYLFAGIYMMVVSGLGLIISNFSSTMQQAMFVMWFIVMVLLLMSGLFTPVTSMPGWAQDVTFFNPMKYMIQAIRMIFLKGSGPVDLTTQLIALASFAIVFNLVAVLSYRKSS